MKLRRCVISLKSPLLVIAISVFLLLYSADLSGENGDTKSTNNVDDKGEVGAVVRVQKKIDNYNKVGLKEWRTSFTADDVTILCNFLKNQSYCQIWYELALVIACNSNGADVSKDLIDYMTRIENWKAFDVKEPSLILLEKLSGIKFLGYVGDAASIDMLDALCTEVGARGIYNEWSASELPDMLDREGDKNIIQMIQGSALLGYAVLGEKSRLDSLRAKYEEYEKTFKLTEYRNYGNRPKLYYYTLSAYSVMKYIEDSDRETFIDETLSDPLIWRKIDLLEDKYDIPDVLDDGSLYLQRW